MGLVPMTGSINEDMLMLQALDPSARLNFSSHTAKWYVDTRLEVGDGATLCGVAEHRASPAEAVEATLGSLQGIEDDQYVVSKFRGHRREWRWNGVAFAECTREEAMQ